MTGLFGPRASLVAATAAVWLSNASVARAEWTVSGYLGAGHTQSAPLEVSQSSAGTAVKLGSVPYRGQSFTPPLYYGYRIAWFPRRSSWFGVEAEFIHLKVYAETAARTRFSGRLEGQSIDAVLPISEVLQRFSISHGLNFVLFNAVARRTIGSTGAASRITVSGRFGAGPTIPHAESTVAGQMAPEGYAWGKLGWQAAGGVQVHLTQHLDAIGEYKFTHSRQRVDVVNGTVAGSFASHHGVFGLGWRF